MEKIVSSYSQDVKTEKSKTKKNTGVSSFDGERLMAIAKINPSKLFRSDIGDSSTSDSDAIPQHAIESNNEIAVAIKDKTKRNARFRQSIYLGGSNNLIDSDSTGDDENVVEDENPNKKRKINATKQIHTFVKQKNRRSQRSISKKNK